MPDSTKNIRCTENITPDSLTGAIFALEGIRDACVILNGPTGCKFYHSAISDGQFLRSLSFDPSEDSGRFHFGQPRVPSTYLDGHDYVFGSGEKLSELLRFAAERRYGLIAVVNSPGAALIGDDLERFVAQEVRDIPCLSLENTGYSGTCGIGYQNALMKVLEVLPPSKSMASPNPATPPKAESSGGHKKYDRTVNLLGMGIYQKYYDGNVEAIRRLFALCGVEVLAAPGTGDGMDTLRKSVRVRRNVVIYPEYGERIAKRYQALYGVQYILSPEGPPIGFDATEALVRAVCEELDADSRPAIEAVERARGQAYMNLARYSSLLGLPKGARFSVKAESSVANALTRWLCSYLGMIPAAISLLDDRHVIAASRLETFLESIGYSDVLNAPILSTPTDIIFADGSTISQARLSEAAVCGVEIALPSLAYLDIVPKTIFGEQGSLYILEQLMNGLRFI